MHAKTDLYIFESTSETTSETKENIIVIDDILSNISREEYIKVKEESLSGDIRGDHSFPLFDSVWEYIMISYNNGLIEKVLVYNRLQEEISRVDPTKVHVEVNSRAYLHLMYDLEDEFSCNFIYNKKQKISKYSIIPPFKNFEILKFIISLIDQLFFIIKRKVLGRSGTNSEYDSIVFPYPGRDESMRPVTDKMDSNILVIIDPRSPWPNSVGYNYPSGWKDYTVRTFNSFASMKVVYIQIKFFISIIADITVNKSLEKQLIQHFANTRNACLKRTIRYTLRKSLNGRLFDFKRAVISEYIFKEFDGIERVLTGSNGSMYRPIWHFASKYDIENYYIPHTVVQPVERDHPPHSETVMFVPGDFGLEVIKENHPNMELPTVVPLGRPYFNKFKINKIKNQNENGLTVMLATQKMDGIRDVFVKHILSVLNNNSDIDKVIIKTHPAESKSHYDKLLESIELKITDKVSIQEKNLESYIIRSDIVFTINSNVGIESLLLETPSISYNKWRPQIPSLPYTTKGPGVLLTNKSELSRFVQNLDEEKIDDLSSNLVQFAENNYVPSENSAAEIAEFIESREN